MGSVSPAGMDWSAFSASISHSFASFIVCLMPGDEGMGKERAPCFCREEIIWVYFFVSWVCMRRGY